VRTFLAYFQEDRCKKYVTAELVTGESKTMNVTRVPARDNARSVIPNSISVQENSALEDSQIVVTEWWSLGHSISSYDPDYSRHCNCE